MKQKNILGYLLIFCSLFVILGMIINYDKLWFIIDIVIIMVNLFAGILLLRKK